MPDTIGIIGMGIMGRPMARNLLKAGFPLVVHNRHQEVTDTFVALGARAANRPCDIAALCDVVITLLPTSADQELNPPKSCKRLVEAMLAAGSWRYVAHQ